MRLRARALVGVLAAVLIGSAVCAASYIEHRNRGRFHYDLGPADPALPDLARAQGYTVHEVDVAPGARLRGVIRPPRHPNDPFVLFFPGNAATQLAVTLPILEGLRANGSAGMATFAYRGYDGSTGRPSVETAPSDARAALDYLRVTFDVSPKRLVIVGYSMGSGTALRLGAELAATSQPPAAVILLSPYWTLELAPSSARGALLPTETYVVEDVIPRVTFPVLVIAGALDEALPVELHAHALMRALGARAEYWELPKADHHDYLGDPALLQRTAAFAWSHLPVSQF
jgi:pimeloyl-ACP methyl ester carboxylesterase